MKTLFRSIAMAFSTFSVIPMPMIEWKKENMKYMLCALPLVGTVICLLLCLWQFICEKLSFGNILFSSGMTFIPLIISGGIHADGFCDTVDSLSSHASPERKREILKDPHTGAFAIIFISAYFIAYLAFCTEAKQTMNAAIIMGVHHILARVVGAMAGVILPVSTSKGMLAAFHEGTSKWAAVFLVIWYILCILVLVFLSPVSGIVSALTAIVLFLYLRSMSCKQFGGMSGDLAGYIVTLSELVLLACYIFTEKAVLLCS